MLTHELTHCGQFERREIGFYSVASRGGFIDYWDELAAYRTQMAYDASTLPQNQYPILTVEWLKEIPVNGKKIYQNDGAVPYNGDSDCSTLNRAYPDGNFNFQGSFSSLRGTYFKNK